ncbi:hypothetical protein ABZY09_32320 [Streptomyces sp. NPDC002928]|uniref:hypothetical protein n=1 Tax=Streptomyces sp. NPDC002928 TaxID=3154440 RepID=UPI0033AC7CB2
MAPTAGWEHEDCGIVTVKGCRYAAALDDDDCIRTARAREAAGEPVEAAPVVPRGGDELGGRGSPRHARAVVTTGPCGHRA